MEFFTFRYRNREDDYEDPRREFLVRALTMGFFAAGGSALAGCASDVLGHRPEKLPPGQSIYRMRGDVRVNGVKPTSDTPIGPAESIETGSNSELVFVVGKDAFMMRENSRLELSPQLAAGGGGGGGASLAGSIIGNLRLVTGKLLSVFGVREENEQLSLHTPTATVGIRGTGVYMESYTGRSYVCTCYGLTQITATGDPGSTEQIASSHHDAPRFILGEGREGHRIEPAPVFNHTDMELLLIESLVGRTPPFMVSGGEYDAPRKISY